ncbi:PIR protein [Plasmodium vivax]|uniref:VIR protein n=1 Tax=Plasmodium vivax TaxID=5855 RepID=A0A564ZPP7_PLAVI|nr:PIR protein [Plasmodium vivax]
MKDSDISFILGDSPSYKLYDTLNENGNTDEPNNYCIRSLKRYEDDYPECMEICEKCAKNLKNLSVIIPNVNNNEERCIYLNLWIYSEISKKFSSYSHKIYELPFVHKFNSVFYLNQNPLNIKCSFTYNKNIHSDLWKKLKDIHDYFINIGYIKSKIPDDKEKCSKYPKYLSYIKDIYASYKRECCNNAYGNCPQDLKFHEWCDMESEISEIKCNETEPSVVSNSDNMAQSAENTDDMAQAEGYSGGRHQGELDTTDNTVDLVDPHTKDLEKDDSNINVVTPTILSCLGTFTTTYLLYKMTPIGSMLNNMLGRNKKIYSNVKVEASNQFMHHIIKYSDIGPENASYQLAYNPA